MTKVKVLGLSVALMASFAFAKDYAIVNGKTITDDDLNVIARAIPGFQGLQTLSKEQTKQLIDQAVERVLLVDAAKKSGIQKDKEYLESLEKLKDDLVLEAWMKKEFNAIEVSDKEVEAFYNENKDKFIQPPQVKAKHILVEKEEDAKEIIKELDGHKGDIKSKFEDLAKSKSTGPSGKNGGELGWFDAKRMVKPFSDAAFALPKNAYTKAPVKTQFGFHVIYVEDKKDESNVALDQELKGKIVQNLKMQKFQKSVKDKATELRKQVKVQYKD